MPSKGWVLWHGVFSGWVEAREARVDKVSVSVRVRVRAQGVKWVRLLFGRLIGCVSGLGYVGDLIEGLLSMGGERGEV